jgi:hypothetical protein
MFLQKTEAAHLQLSRREHKAMQKRLSDFKAVDLSGPYTSGAVKCRKSKKKISFRIVIVNAAMSLIVIALFAWILTLVGPAIDHSMDELGIPKVTEQR